jgi:hypothetical protein
LVADDDYLYILEAPHMNSRGTDTTITRPGRILKCPLSGCAEPTVLYASTAEFSMDQLMVDDHFVYFAGTDCSPNSVWFSRCGFISAIPK